MNSIVDRNINLFRNHCNEINFYLEEGQNESYTYFACNERTDNGANIRLVASFSTEYPSVDVYCFNLADITDPLKKETALKHINELNNNYRYAKFLLGNDGVVTIQSCLDFTDTNFAPELVIKHMMMLYHAANDEYKNFMKIAWA